MSSQVTKPNRKHNWMRGFVLGKATSDIDKVRFESMARTREYRNKLIKHGK